MTFSLDFALFYAYTLALFAFLAFWIVPQLFRALTGAISNLLESRRGQPPAGPSKRALGRASEEAIRPRTRFEAFTQL